MNELKPIGLSAGNGVFHTLAENGALSSGINMIFFPGVPGLHGHSGANTRAAAARYYISGRTDVGWARAIRDGTKSARRQNIFHHRKARWEIAR